MHNYPVIYSRKKLNMYIIEIDIRKIYHKSSIVNSHGIQLTNEPFSFGIEATAHDWYSIYLFLIAEVISFGQFTTTSLTYGVIHL